MAEFPDFGRHCSEEMCNKLDYLPIQCNSCSKPYCSFHFSFEEHNCVGPRLKDVRVPVCSKCSEPVPVGKNEDPEAKMKAHLDANCATSKTQIFKKYCTVDNCRKRELLPVTCTLCKMQFCLRHRHTADHKCKVVLDKSKFVMRGPFIVSKNTVKVH
ncbi:hypothetical protein L596_022876 [Steinernema carpocapsae]|uniref:AN1-type domain-containing protein n=1 Tax=Steinernema carpocapsae TaxID=34508 RepID=A0A4U5MC37_STECR|nr:hypothetical protein L596_022876 [Steinernema carpocapsae]